MTKQTSIQELVSELKTNLQKGLSEADAASRLRQHGKNELPDAKKKSLSARFWEQLQDPLIYVLLAASSISLLLNEISDTVIILFVVLMNAIIGLIQEGKAQKALDSLKQLSSPHAVVIRDGIRKDIAAALLVPGDIVCLEAGCQVPADIRLTEVESLKAEEASLTGESASVEKSLRLPPGYRNTALKEVPLGDRVNMAYMSTVITYGRGKGIVTATGIHTEIGKIARLIQESPEDTTPLQKRLGELGTLLSLLSLILCTLLFFIGLMQHRNLFEMLITAISLAVAAVPEGLPAVVTICLALSVTRMVRVHTIVRKLPSVETLGAVSVICSDKTGTLTQNRMSVVNCYCDCKLFPANALHPKMHSDLLTAITLCNDSSLEKTGNIGDPTELALLELSAKYQFHRTALEQNMPRLGELPFDSDRRMMTTFHRTPKGGISYTKGAPDEILRLCTKIQISGRILPIQQEHLTEIRKQMKMMSSKALRTLAVAMHPHTTCAVERELVFIGLIGMQDPVRPEAAAAVQSCKNAGIRTAMITGDHIDTAYAIARELNIVQDRSECLSGSEIATLSEQDFLKKLKSVRVFARISPQQKVQIVQGFQRNNHIVAMTGDGVNDAPSLKMADVGIAMGMNGTDVAKQAADIVLTDDNFATIAQAVREGRNVYTNIRKSVIFLLSSNLGEIMTMFLAVICGLASPLKSSHILWINLITDSLPALALGIDENDGNALMKQPPRKGNESLFAGGGLSCTCFYGFLIAAISLTAFLTFPYVTLQQNRLPITLENLSALLSQEPVLLRAQTYAFTVLGISQLFHAIGMRNIHRSVFCMHLLRNPLMLVAVAIGLTLQFAVTEIPFLIHAFGTVDLLPSEWVFLGILAAFPLLAHELFVLTAPAKKEKSCKKST